MAKKLKGPSADELRARVLAVKPKLKGHSYIKLATDAVPEYDTAAGGVRIINVWNLRSTDLRVTEAWEQAAERLNTPSSDEHLLRPRELTAAAA